MCCSPDALRWSRERDDPREASEHEPLVTSTLPTRPERRDAEEPEEAAAWGDGIACC